MCIPWGKNPFFSTKVKVICQGQGQNIKVKVFEKIAIARALVCHKHILFDNAFKNFVRVAKSVNCLGKG